MKVAPYILYGQSMVDDVRVRLQDCLFSWMREWGLPDGFSLAAVAFDTPFNKALFDRPALLLNVTGNRDQWVLFSLAGPALAQLCAILLNDDRRIAAGYHGEIQDAIQSELAERCLCELAMVVTNQKERCSLDINKLPPPFDEYSIYQELRPGAGVVNFQVLFEDHFEIDVFVSSAIMNPAESVGAADYKSEESLYSRKEALGKGKVQAKVVLNDIELTLDALGSISVGDVILLDQSVDEPCMVKFEDSRLRCKGFLGKKKEKLAVKVDSLMK